MVLIRTSFEKERLKRIHGKCRLHFILIEKSLLEPTESDTKKSSNINLYTYRCAMDYIESNLQKKIANSRSMKNLYVSSNEQKKRNKF